MTLRVPIHGSNVRDFAMLERNFLTHVRFAVVLSLLSSSLLLNTRLPSPSEPEGTTPPHSKATIPIAVLQVVAAVVAVFAGLWEYERGFRDMHTMKAFLTATKPHTIIMFGVSMVVFATCIVLVADAGI
ncbi:hypothetical protein BXZ70DRAFT_1005538 [Cristinia sonorae]|uniref:DUF202 domain-containing protein n=1 Tax=Cristinia sonorae TaxID=1940300 RepID=A0A8K0UUW2_9AGAR|nr:hypothetical protein BXZ70DRAFT_1005538 [Cristinia sonorae]